MCMVAVMDFVWGTGREEVSVIYKLLKDTTCPWHYHHHQVDSFYKVQGAKSRDFLAVVNQQNLTVILTYAVLSQLWKLVHNITLVILRLWTIRKRKAKVVEGQNIDKMYKFGFNMSTGSLLGWQDIYDVYDDGMYPDNIYPDEPDDLDTVTDKHILAAVSEWYINSAVCLFV